MSIDRDDRDKHQTRRDGMIKEFQDARGRRLAVAERLRTVTAAVAAATGQDQASESPAADSAAECGVPTSPPPFRG